MSSPSSLRHILRFGAYQCDLSAGELHKNGIKVKLSDQPFRLLAILLERPGEIVTRRELSEQLWPAGTFVEFEDGLNTAIKKLRLALDDPAENPRFLETIPRRGYRFIAPVEEVAESSANTSAAHGAPPIAEATLPRVAAVLAKNTHRARWIWIAGLAAAVLFALWWATPVPPPRVIRVEQITTRSNIDTPVKPTTDGAHVFYIARHGGHWDMMETSVNGGEERKIEFPAQSAMVMDVSAHASELLVGSFPSRNVVPQLWSMPLEGGAAKRLDIAAVAAAFSPDGKKIAYVSNGGLWFMNRDGTGARKVAEVPTDAGWLVWSPDGRTLRFTEGRLFEDPQTSLWEISADGKNLHHILSGWAQSKECCGSWTRDGRYYIFTAYRHGHSNLWAVREKTSPWRRSPRGPFQLTFGPDSPWGGTPSRDNRHIFFYNGVWREDLALLHIKSGEVSPMLVSPGAMHVAYSRDGNWMAYVDSRSHALYRSRADGAQRIELAPPDLNASFPRWSPDGKWIVFGGEAPGEHGNSYVVAAAGGRAQLLVPDAHLQDADWSSDGKSLVASQEMGDRKADIRRLVIIDFSTRRAKEIPGSESLAMSRWSFNGKFISATTEDQTQLRIFNISRGKWTLIARGTALGISVWSPDSSFLYFQDVLSKGEPLMRYDVQSRSTEEIADFTKILSTGADRCALFGTTPDGTPIVGLNRSGLDLFAAEVRLP